ncbi:MAG: DUF378 domain-containing protein [bacterium]|nr:DUF378 domain-containing protein [bacterium]
MKGLHTLSFILVIIGGLNWGLVGLGDFLGGDWNVVHMILGLWPMVEWLVYLLVGIGALVLVATHKKDCRACGVSSSGSAPMGM